MKYVFKRKPRPHQLHALQKALELDYAMALWFDPGVGKTKVAIDFMGVKAMKQQLHTVLIICPLSAMGVWEDEIPQDLPDNISRKVIPIVGDMTTRIQLIKDNTKLTHDLNIMVINYDSLRNENVFKLLYNWKPELIIIDEMHFTKNYTAQRTKIVYKLRQRALWVLGLTGTPIPKNYLDVFSQYKILDERIFGTKYVAFRDRYAIMHHMFRNKPIHWKNLDELAKKIHTIAFRVKDTECSSLTSELIIRDVPVYLTDKTKKYYKQMAEEMIMELENMEIVTASIAAVKVGKLQQITGGFVQRVDKVLEDGKIKKTVATFPVGTEKLDVCMDLIDNYVENHKILIGCRFLWEIKQIETRLTKKKIKFFTIKGGVSGEERADARRKFQSDESYRVIIFQVSAATAMTLTAANIAILYSCTQKWDDYWQWLKRIHRDGQEKPVNVFRLIAKGTVDKQIMANLKQKSEYTAEMIDKSKFRKLITPEF